MGLSYAYLYTRHASSTLDLAVVLIVFSLLFTIIVSDLEHYVIPDSILVILIGVIIIYGFLTGLTGERMVEHVLSGLGAMGLFIIAWVLTGGRGMGFGDVKLVFVLGLLLGYPSIVFALYAAFITGAALGMGLIVTRRKTMKSRVPFGPFLIAGAFLTDVFHSQLLLLWERYIGM